MISTSLYSIYLKERQNAHILENERGFIIYKIREKECFIIDMFVAVQFRRTGAARALIEMLEDICVCNGATEMTGQIHIDAKGSQHALFAALGVGFEVVAGQNKTLFIKKQVFGGDDGKVG